MSNLEIKWGHDQLANDLADHLFNPNRMVWTDFIMGSAGNCRPDVFTLKKSFTNPDSRAYEIKVSTADFRSDITSGKWRKYLKYASCVTFCTPKGLVAKADIPAGCGLMVRGENGWSTVKAPTRQVMPELDRDLWMKLLMSGIDQERCVVRDRNRYQFNKFKASKDNFSKEVCDVLRDIEFAKSRAVEIISRAEAKGKLIIDSQEKKTGDLQKTLDLYSQEFGHKFWDFREASRHIKQMKSRCDSDVEVVRVKEKMKLMKNQMQNIFSTLDSAIDEA